MKSVAFTLAVLLATLTVAQATEQTAEQATEQTAGQAQPVEATQPLDVNSSSDAAPAATEEPAAPAQN